MEINTANIENDLEELSRNILRIINGGAASEKFHADYPALNSSDFERELTRHKEFYSLKLDREMKNADIFKVLSSHNLRLQSYQVFVKNFLNPSSQYKRLLIKHATGVGKTISGISIANEFIKYYKYLYYSLSIQLPFGKRSSVELDRLTPTVYIFGFSNTQTAFYSELIKYPDFGFITHEERAELDYLQSKIVSGDFNDRNNYEEFIRMVRSRITNKTKGGFYKFFGYQEFVYKLFLPKTDITLVKLEQIATHEKRLLSDIINEHISRGELELNKQLMAKFENSLIICDEIHNVYNSMNKNNYGVAIQLILDMVPSLRAVFLSATPINNSPTEVVDIANLLLPAASRISKSDIFDSSLKLKSGAKELIREKFRGRVSFLQDIDPRFFPERIYEGNTHILAEPVNGMTELPYLKFQECVMSDLHAKTLETFIENYKMSANMENINTPSNNINISTPINNINIADHIDKMSADASANVSGMGAAAGMQSSSEINKELQVDELALDIMDEIENEDIKNGGTSIYENIIDDNYNDDNIIDGSAIVKNKIKNKNKNIKNKIEINKIKKQNLPDETPQITNETSDEFDAVIGDYRISIDEYYIRDLVFPSPIPAESRAEEKVIEDKSTDKIKLLQYPSVKIHNEKVYGSFRTRKIIPNINIGSPQWRSAIGVNVERTSTVDLIRGDFLKLSNISKYSGKYARMVEKLISILKKNGESPSPEKTCPKIMIYHDRVRLSGVLLIQEILRENNFIDEISVPTDYTICRLCGGARIDHSKKENHTHKDIHNSKKHYHEFSPARFIMAHSDINKKTMENGLKRYNSPTNMHGEQIQILVGSKIIREGYTMKEVQYLLIMSMPINIPTLIQIFGRVDRKSSHLNLPPSQRIVYINIFINVFGKDNNKIMNSPEEIYYAEKLSTYMLIQDIEREINSSAIDAEINHDINFPDSWIKDPHKKQLRTLGNLYFSEPQLTEYNYSDLNLTTYFTYGYNEIEIKNIIYMIKELFKISPVYTYEQLLDKVKSPPFHMEFNTRLISDDNFIIALNSMVKPTIKIINNADSKLTSSEDIISKLFNPNDKYIYMENAGIMSAEIQQEIPTEILNTEKTTNINTEKTTNSTNSLITYTTSLTDFNKYQKYKIEHVGEYYVRFPVEMTYNELMSRDTVLKDVDIYMNNTYNLSNGVSFDIDNYVSLNKSEENYISQREKYFNKYINNTFIFDDIADFLTLFNLDFYNYFMEDAITYLNTGYERDTKNTLIIHSKITNKMRAETYLAISNVLMDIQLMFSRNQIHSRDIINKYKLSEYPAKMPIGYMRNYSAVIYYNGTFTEVNKPLIFANVGTRENTNLIGYLEILDNTMKFKTRKPSAVTSSDMRKMERGMVCLTKTKKQLLDLCKLIGVNTAKLENTTSTKICQTIMLRLIELEIKQREKKTNIKYFYNFTTAPVGSIVENATQIAEDEK